MSRVALQPLFQTARVHHQAGRLDQAERIYQQLRAAAPNHFDIFHFSGLLAQQQGRQADAVQWLSRAAKLNPNHVINVAKLGTSLAATGNFADAETCLQAAAKQTPANAEIWSHLGFTLNAVGRYAEAIAAFEKAAALKPGDAELLCQLGAVVGSMRGLPAGIPYFQKALGLKPDSAPALGNLGLALSVEGKFLEAIAAFDRALKADPHLAQARVGRASALMQTQRVEEAANEFKTVLIHHPTNHEARTGRLLTLNYLSGLTRQEVFNEHLAFDRALKNASREKSPAKLPPRAVSSDRLRVAFLSPDFRRHSVAFFIEPLLRHLDRRQFEIILYHDHFEVDAFSERLKGLADLWRNFVGLPHEAVEQRIRADAPDVLIDLAGHMGQTRMPIFAKRVAPVQISYLGYPNTTGLREMDYRFVDSITDPGPEDDRYHTEKLVRFSPCAWTFQPPDDAPEPKIRERVLVNGRPAIVFGSFNTLAKISAATVKLWGAILKAVPNSTLLLKGHGLNDSAIAELIRGRLAGAIDDPGRIRLTGRTATISDHLALYGDIDLALDPTPYNGTTTTCEALWMGVPVVALYGDRHAARVSASLLTAVKHPEWIARTPEEYVRLATELAADGNRLDQLRPTLRTDLKESVLFDYAGQAQRFGEAIKTCRNERLKGSVK